MDSYEWNKIAGAVLFALLLAVGLRIFSEVIFETEAPETPGYVIAEAGEAGGAAEEAPAAEPIGVLLASADAAAGEKSAKKCLACHTFGEGEANKVGPNLYGVVNRPVAGHEGYQYSDAMQAFASEAGTWTYDHLNTFLTNPAGTVPQTKMTFAGLKDDHERANVIAYLRTLAATPAPLPEQEAAAPEAPAATQTAEAAPAEAPAADQPAPTEMAAEPQPEQMAAAEPKPMEPAPMAATPEPAPMAAAPEPAPMAAAPEPAPMAAAPEPAPMAAAPEPAPMAATPEPAPAEQQMAAAPEPAPAEQAAAPSAGDPAKGASYAKRCLACHSVNEGGGIKVGPPLFGVVGRPVASVPGFKYSDAMIAFSDGGNKVWDAGTLDSYLADPRKVVKGTKMAFPGVKDADRANVIAYLESLK